MYELNNIGGYTEIKQDISTIIKLLKNYNEYTINGAQIPSGLLLYGPVGCGKSLIAKTIALESNIHLLTLDDYRFKENKVISQIEAINNLFNDANKYKPCLVLIDDIDHLISYDIEYETDNQRESYKLLLHRLDIKNNSIFVIATSNLKNINKNLALTRTGRFDRHIFVDIPTLQDRIEILNLYLNENNVFRKVDIELLAKRINGFKCSDIKSLVNYVLIYSLENNIEYVKTNDFNSFISNIMFNDIKKISSEDLYCIAVHEVGHFLVDYILNDSIGVLSIQSYGKTSGVYRPSVELKLNSFTECYNLVSVKLAGLAATEVILGEKYLGAYSDIGEAERIYNHMKESGLFGFKNLKSDFFLPSDNKITEDGSKFLQKAYITAKTIINANNGIVKYLSKELMDKTTLYEDDLLNLINKYNKNSINNALITKDELFPVIQ